MKSCRQQTLGEKKWKAKGNQQIWMEGQKLIKRLLK